MVVMVVRHDLLAHFPASLQVLASVLAEGGVEVRLVGGAVRDLLSGMKPKDFDLATPLKPDEVKSALQLAGIRTVDTGVAHGTITAIMAGSNSFCETSHPQSLSSGGFETYEVTTLRRDVSTDGRRATVAWTTSWELYLDSLTIRERRHIMPL